MFRTSHGGLRTIGTARNSLSLHLAQKRGYTLLFKEVIHTNEFRSKYAVLMHKRYGFIKISSDFRDVLGDSSYITIIDYKWIPHRIPKSKKAAYLIPKDLKKGERVFLKDLIENHVGRCWNQGDVSRLKSSEAIWNGEDFEIVADEVNNTCWMG